MSGVLTVKSLENFHKNSGEHIISAIFENGVLKPLTKLKLPEGKKLTLVVYEKEQSVAERIYGICKPQHSLDIDAIIDSEDWH